MPLGEERPQLVGRRLVDGPAQVEPAHLDADVLRQRVRGERPRREIVLLQPGDGAGQTVVEGDRVVAQALHGLAVLEERHRERLLGQGDQRGAEALQCLRRVELGARHLVDVVVDATDAARAVHEHGHAADVLGTAERQVRLTRPTLLQRQDRAAGDVLRVHPRDGEADVVVDLLAQRPHDPQVEARRLHRAVDLGRRPVGAARDHDVDVSALARPPPRLEVRLLLGERVRVGARVLQDGRVLGERSARHVEERGGVQRGHPPHPERGGRLEDVDGPADVHGLVLGDVLLRAAEDGRRVDGRIAALGGGQDVLGNGDVAPDDLGAQRLDGRGVGPGAHERPHARPGAAELLDDVRADETGAAGQEHAAAHERFSMGPS